MLPIPKELQGQKAIPFMEWCHSEMIVHFNNELYLGCEVVYDVHKQHKIYVFLSQPFTPEMLQEYFEGWVCKDIGNGEYYQYKRIVVYYNEYPKEYVIYDDDDNYFIFKTLNDFITLCNLEGINLKWKGETE